MNLADLDISRTTYDLEQFEDRLASLDANSQLDALHELRNDLSRYLKDLGLHAIPKDNKCQIPEKYTSIIHKIIGLGQKIAALERNKDHSIKETADAALSLPEEAVKQGFVLINGYTISQGGNTVLIMFHDGIFKDLTWENEELIVSTSENYQFALKSVNGNLQSRNITDGMVIITKSLHPSAP